MEITNETKNIELIKYIEELENENRQKDIVFYTKNKSFAESKKHKIYGFRLLLL